MSRLTLRSANNTAAVKHDLRSHSTPRKRVHSLARVKEPQAAESSFGTNLGLGLEGPGQNFGLHK